MNGTMIGFKPGQPDPWVKHLKGALDLDELQRFVGGYIELVPYFDTITYAGVLQHCVAFCDEHYIRKNLPPNHLANAYWQEALRRQSFSPREQLCGNVVVLFGDDDFMATL